jgi:hypothetical protein
MVLSHSAGAYDAYLRTEVKDDSPITRQDVVGVVDVLSLQLAVFQCPPPRKELIFTLLHRSQYN